MVCPSDIRDEDINRIKNEANERFFLILGKRSDTKLLELIPFAENVIVIDGICVACLGYGSFASHDGKKILCRGCRIMEKERIRILDEKIQERLVFDRNNVIMFLHLVILADAPIVAEKQD